MLRVDQLRFLDWDVLPRRQVNALYVELYTTTTPLR